MCKNGECHIYSFAFDGGIVWICIFIHNDSGALNLLHDGREERMIAAGAAWPGMARCGLVRRGKAGVVRRGLVGRSQVWRSKAGAARHGESGAGVVGQSEAGVVWSDLARCGVVWQGNAGKARQVKD